MPIQQRVRRAAQRLGNMRTRAIRWIAVPLAAASGYYFAAALCTYIIISCMAFFIPKEGCSYWGHNQEWVAPLALGTVAFVLSVLLPALLAPKRKRLVGAVALAVVALLTLALFSPWVWLRAIPTLALLAVLCALFPPIARRIPADVA